MRILSVLPSATEIVYALGGGAELVGRSAECDYPAGARDLPIVMEATSDDADCSSQEIDQRVQATRGHGESLYRLNLPLLAALRPDVVLTQDLCGVCSVTPAEVTAACHAVGIDPALVSLTPRTLDEVLDSVEAIGRAIGHPTSGGELAANLRARAASRLETASGVTTVTVVEWLDPPILAGLWTPDVVERAGGTYLGPQPGEVGRRTTWDEVLAQSPDLLILSPCSYSTPRTWEELRATPLGRRLGSARAPRGVWVVDESYFSRPGPRLVDGLELVRALVTGEPPSDPMRARRWDPLRTEAIA